MSDKYTYEDLRSRLDNKTEATRAKVNEYDERVIVPFAKTLERRVEKAQKVVGLFDFDCDGVMSALIGKQIIPEMEVHIGDRYVDGYGIMRDLSFLKKGDLVICGDLGSTEATRVREIIDRTGEYPLIIDHHEVTDDMKKYPFLLNFCKYDDMPKDERPDWCTSGLFFQLAYHMCETKEQLYLCALYNMCGTVADVVKVNNPYDTNREDIQYAFEILNNEKNLKLIDRAFSYFLYKAGIEEAPHVTTSLLNFNLNPVINALGRIGTINDYGVTGGQFLFDTLDPYRDMLPSVREERINECFEVNKRRKDMEKEILESEEYQTYVKNFNKDKEKIALVYLKDLHKGLCGRIAQCLVSELSVPAICFCGSGTDITGSARNMKGFPNMFEAVKQAKEASNSSVTIGGHADAFGLHGSATDLKNSHLCSAIKNVYKDIEPVEVEEKPIDLKTISVDRLLSLEPFGVDFPAPHVDEAFVIKNIKQLSGGYTAITEDDVKFFGKMENAKKGFTIHAEGTLAINYYAGKETLQVSVDKHEFGRIEEHELGAKPQKTVHAEGVEIQDEHENELEERGA